LKRSKKQIKREEQLYQLTTLAAGRISLQEVLDRLAEAAVKITNVKACSIRLLDDESGELKMRSTYGLSEEYRNKGVVSKNDSVVKAAFEGEAVVLDDMRIDDRVKYKQAAVKEGLVSQLTVAMKFRDNAIGVLRLYSPKPKRFFDENIALARAIASQCAVAITNAKLYSEAIEGHRIAEQIRLGGIIQRRMIPEKAPEISGLDIASAYVPCFDVGGDFYDFFKINEHSIAITISDVMGKGVPAAILMSMFRGAARAYAECECGYGGIKGIINKLNHMACRECRSGEFITLFYAIIDVKQRALTYCNCGHEPTILLRDNKIIDLDKGGLVLGVSPDAEYTIDNIELKQSDSLLFYTDGLIDTANFEGEFWSRESLVEILEGLKADSAAQIINHVLGHRRRFAGLSRQIDDTSIIAVKLDDF
jgi:sigma-B regulation protein RsbU (phosphoserine phosphatase)